MHVSGSPPTVRHVEPVMGTMVSIAIHETPGPEASVRAAIDDACRLLHRYDAMFSTWMPQSPISRLRRGELTLAELPPEAQHVLELCDEAHQLSGGWFDAWAMPGGVDPTGLVKGWALEEALAVLHRAGVANALVNGGGDLAATGHPRPGAPWRVGVRHPWDAGALACIVEVQSAVATSGSYERGAHLVDPHSGTPAVAAASATVTGPHLALADALATALAVGGDDVLARVAALDGYEGYLIRLDASEASTDGMAFADD